MREWANEVKRYYLDIEDYDWVDVTDHFKGVESIFHWNRMRVMLRLTQAHETGTPIIDVGCGSGLILRKLPPNSIGLDINPRAIAMALKHAPEAQLIVSDAENIPFRSACFPLVICTEVLEHVPSPDAVIDEVQRLLRRGGRLIGSVPHDTVLWKFRVLSSTCPHAEPFHNQYRRSEVRRLLKAFKILLLRLSTLRLNVVFVAERA